MALIIDITLTINEIPNFILDKIVKGYCAHRGQEAHTRTLRKCNRAALVFLGVIVALVLLLFYGFSVVASNIEPRIPYNPFDKTR